MSIYLKELTRDSLSVTLTALSSFNGIDKRLATNVNLIYTPRIGNYNDINYDVLDIKIGNPLISYNWECSAVNLNSDYVYLSCKENDKTSVNLLLSTCTLDETLTSEYIFTPLYPTILSQYSLTDPNVINISAVLINDETNQISSLNDFIIKWAASDNNLSAKSLINNNDYYFSYGYGTTAAFLSLTSLDGLDKILNFHINDNNFSIRTSASVFYDPTPETHILTVSSDTNYCYVSSVFLRDSDTYKIEPNTNLIWSVNPTEGIIISAINAQSLYQQGNISSSNLIDYLFLSCNRYDLTYNISLSSKYNINTIVFEPYLFLTNSSDISSILIPISENTPVKKYKIKLYGITNGIIHNIYNGTKLAYEKDTSTSNLVFFDVNNFGYNFYPATNLLNENNINPLNFDFYSDPNTETVRVCSYQIRALISNTSNINDILLSKNINFSITENIGKNIADPNFTINYEPKHIFDLYRNIPLTNWYTVSIGNASEFHPSIGGKLKFQFNDNNIIEKDINFSDKFTYTLSAFSPLICSISLTATISSDFWSGFENKVIQPKTINFVSNFLTSDFIIYPKYYWDNVNNNFKLTTLYTDLPMSPSSYGFCHEEIYTLSAIPHSSASYKWYIDKYLPYPINSTTNTIIRSFTNNDNNLKEHKIVLGVFNNELSSNMPSSYYDDFTGLSAIYPNFTTSEINQSNIKSSIKIYPIGSLGQSNIDVIKYDQLPVPSDLDLTSSFLINSAGPLSSIGFGIYSFTLSSKNWISNNQTINPTKSFSFLISNDPFKEFYIEKFYPTKINLDLTVKVVPKLPQTPFNDWCTSPTVDLNPYITTISAYPLTPFIYTNSKYVLSGENVIFQNLVPYFSGISNFIWTDRGISLSATTNSNYITSYNDDGYYNLTLTTVFSSYDTVKKYENTFLNVIDVLNGFTLFDNNITRIYNSTKLKFPWTLEECKIPINEFSTYDNINACLIKLNDNLNYLKNMSKLYDIAPTEYYGWLGSYNNNFYWRVNQFGIDYIYNQPDLAENNSKLTNLKDVVYKNGYFAISNKTSVSLISADFFGTEINNISKKGVDDEFVNIVSVELDNNFGVENRVYILDGDKNRVVVYNYNFNTNNWNLLYSWGGLGGPSAKFKYNSPSDLLIDKDNYLWVVDSGNKAVKKCSRTGSWLLTIYTDKNSEYLPIGCFIYKNNVYILCKNELLIYDKVTGLYISKLNLNYSDIPNSITECQDRGYFYLTFDNRISKYDLTGQFAGDIANGNDFNINKTYLKAYHDVNRNLYITNENKIIKYIDKLTIINLREDFDNYEWPLEKILVKDELHQDWVLNKAFARFWDNLELFRRSIIGKFVYLNNRPTIKTFDIDEYKFFKYNKTDIYVGINEFVLAEVFNRCIEMLYENQKTLLTMISD